MGIHPYGLFGTYESNTSFGSSYEIKHQLETRQSQLDALSKKENLSDKELAKKEQLSNAVNQLQKRLNHNSTNNNQTTFSAQLSNTDSVVKNINSSSAASPDNKVSPLSRNFAEGSVVAKSMYNNSAQKTADDASYLKGFFVDLKI